MVNAALHWFSLRVVCSWFAQGQRVAGPSLHPGLPGVRCYEGQVEQDRHRRGGLRGPRRLLLVGPSSRVSECVSARLERRALSSPTGAMAGVDSDDWPIRRDHPPAGRRECTEVFLQVHRAATIQPNVGQRPSQDEGLSQEGVDLEHRSPRVSLLQHGVVDLPGAHEEEEPSLLGWVLWSRDSRMGHPPGFEAIRFHRGQ